MRYVELEGHTPNDVVRHRHNDEGFYNKYAYQISINRGRMTTTQVLIKAL